MLKIYSDAAFDRFTGLGCYCLVVINGDYKDYSVDNIDGCTNSTQAELAGLRAALEIAAKAGKQSEIFCDSMGAISQIAYEWQHGESDIVPLAFVRHFKGHQLGSDGVVIDDDVKRHHWADTMACHELRRRLDIRKTVAYDEKVKET